MNQHTIYGSYLISNPEPTMSITHNRGRLKQYGYCVYMQTGWNFEIELFNPKQISVLAKIFINGIVLSHSGIVLRPGQRVYLERFIDTSNKFVFNTYEVENSNESIEAIANNGIITVSFYDEITHNVNNIGTSINSPTWLYSNDTVTNLPNINGICGAAINTRSLLNTGSLFETGRVEKGESSNQTFDYMNGSFHQYSSIIWTIHILPISKKPLEANEFTTYCTKCGTRKRKSTWKFCPACGNSINN